MEGTTSLSTQNIYLTSHYDTSQAIVQKSICDSIQSNSGPLRAREAQAISKTPQLPLHHCHELLSMLNFIIPGSTKLCRLCARCRQIAWSGSDPHQHSAHSEEEIKNKFIVDVT